MPLYAQKEPHILNLYSFSMKKLLFFILALFPIASFTENVTYDDPPSCATVEPACSGTSCTLTYSPTQSNQSWVKNANSCGFTCTNGYV